jgi:hypothetical protein
MDKVRDMEGQTLSPMNPKWQTVIQPTDWRLSLRSVQPPDELAVQLGAV